MAEQLQEFDGTPEFYATWLREALTAQDAPGTLTRDIISRVTAITEDTVFVDSCRFEGLDISGLYNCLEVARQHLKTRIEETADNLQRCIFDARLFNRVELVTEAGNLAVTGVVAGPERLLAITDRGVPYVDDIKAVTIEL